MNYDPAIADVLQQTLQQGQSIRLRISSDSMSPIIGVGDRVVVESVASADIRLGDVLVLRIPDGTLTHRLIAKTRSGWVTKGDHLLAADTPHSVDVILGRVVVVERAGGAKILLNQQPWRIINPILGGVNWFIAQLYSFWGKFRH
jgi:signal peptidase I